MPQQPAALLTAATANKAKKARQRRIGENSYGGIGGGTARDSRQPLAPAAGANALPSCLAGGTYVGGRPGLAAAVSQLKLENSLWRAAAYQQWQQPAASTPALAKRPIATGGILRPAVRWPDPGTSARDVGTAASALR